MTGCCTCGAHKRLARLTAKQDEDDGKLFLLQEMTHDQGILPEMLSMFAHKVHVECADIFTGSL